MGDRGGSEEDGVEFDVQVGVVGRNGELLGVGVADLRLEQHTG